MMDRRVRSMSASTRAALDGWTGYGRRMSATPAPANTSASPNFAQQIPTAPALDLPSRDDRGLVRLGVRPEANAGAAIARPAARAMFWRSLARSTTTRGVGMEESPRGAAWFSGFDEFHRIRTLGESAEPPRTRTSSGTPPDLVGVAREDASRCLSTPRWRDDDLREDVAEVGRDREVAALVALFGREAGPRAVDLAAADAAAEDEHRVAVAVVGAAVAVLLHRPAELRHREHTMSAMRSPRSVASAAMPCAKSSSRAGELAGRAALVDVRVPAAELGERDLEADVRLDELRDLPQRLAERRSRVVGAVAPACNCAGFAPSSASSSRRTPRGRSDSAARRPPPRTRPRTWTPPCRSSASGADAELAELR